MAFSARLPVNREGWPDRRQPPLVQGNDLWQKREAQCRNDGVLNASRVLSLSIFGQVCGVRWGGLHGNCPRYYAQYPQPLPETPLPTLKSLMLPFSNMFRRAAGIARGWHTFWLPNVLVFSLAPRPASAEAPAALPRLVAPQMQLPAATRVPPVNRPLYSKELGLGLIGGLYGVVYTWTYFAWYKNRATTDDIVFASEGLFGPDTYAGGSDKMGHAWGNYIINRWTANVLATGGWAPLERSLISTASTMAFFTMIELKDGYHKGFGFSWWDMAFNTAGNALAVWATLVPRIDEMFDFKVYYLPTRAYLRSLTDKGVVNAGEDYTGQTFTLAYHLTSIGAIKRDPALSWLRYVDLTLGFRSRNYLPEPVSPNTSRLQELSLGLAFNVQHLLDVAYDWEEAPRSHTHSSLRFFLEGFGVPYTNFHLVRYQQRNGPAPLEQEEGP